MSFQIYVHLETIFDALKSLKSTLETARYQSGFAVMKDVNQKTTRQNRYMISILAKQPVEHHFEFQIPPRIRKFRDLSKARLLTQETHQYKRTRTHFSQLITRTHRPKCPDTSAHQLFEYKANQDLACIADKDGQT